ncbi:WbqC family protein [Riemerella anatipestifer]|uniref:WbqC family protein n=1 Tax=Riemerella anatipestifer TaxID=34085 RepID=UPI0012AD8A14|nr:WbqC family protein [Riemerella anatipestifer]USL95349.1 WbqC family protein [Riemerella anatipestifer]
MKLLPLFYLPPISWWSEFLSEESVILEQYENFPKQTYRNRANIYGANGKLSLSIPIKHNGKRALKDLEISYDENWQSLHWKSIKIAYQTSPYFEFYESKLEKIFQSKETYLKDFNLKALDIIQDILKTDKTFQLSESYEKEIEGEDYRDCFSAKQPTSYDVNEYYQTFSDKLGFLEDLSILDLICNIGPEATTYIRNVKLKK